MGLRSRLKDQLRRSLGRDAPAPAPVPPPASAPRPAPPPAPAAAAAPAPVAPPPSAPEPAAAPPSPAPAARIQLNALLVAEDGPTDAPTRTAHHARIVESTDRAFEVRVYSSSLDIRFPVEPGEAVLDAAERAGHVLPYSCRSGGCLSCAAHLDAGETEMEEQYVLEPEQLDAGFRLLCVTTVQGPATFEIEVEERLEA